MSQKELILSYFKENPDRDIQHKEVVDWAVEKWKDVTGEVFRDPDRAIRSLYSERVLIKIKKGVYRYNLDKTQKRTQINFTTKQKKEIFQRDRHKCVICGRGEAEGQEIHADHIRPQELGGESTIDNGQTLCAPHNFKKKTFSQTETGKNMFIRLYDLADKARDEKVKKFCNDVLKVYEEHGIDGHIKWKKKL